MPRAPQRGWPPVKQIISPRMTQMNTDLAGLCFHPLRGLRPASSPEPHGKAQRPLAVEAQSKMLRFPTGSGDDAAARSAGAQVVEAQARLPMVESVCVRVHPWAIDSLSIHPGTVKLQESPSRAGGLPVSNYRVPGDSLIQRRCLVASDRPASSAKFSPRSLCRIPESGNNLSSRALRYPKSNLPSAALNPYGPSVPKRQRSAPRISTARRVAAALT